MELKKKETSTKSLYANLGAIGAGSCGTCDLVRSKRDGGTYVMKTIDIARCFPAEKRASFQEVKLLQKLRHPNIVAYRDAFVHKHRDLCIVMELCEGGDLHSKIRDRGHKMGEPLRSEKLMNEDEILDWTVQMSLALHYLHKRKILHRDIKPHNVFLTKALGVKIGDFGVARILDRSESLARTTVGTPYYMSPEVLRCRPYSYKSDCWALGCVLYELMCLQRPFEGRDMEDLKKRVCAGQYPMAPETFSEGLRELLYSLLQVDPKERPKPAQLLQLPVIQPYLKKFCEDTIRNAPSYGDANNSKEYTEQGLSIVALLEKTAISDQAEEGMDQLVEGLNAAEDASKQQIKRELKILNEALTGASEGAPEWQQLRDCELQLEVQELRLQLLQLITKWTSQNAPSEVLATDRMPRFSTIYGLEIDPNHGASSDGAPGEEFVAAQTSPPVVPPPQAQTSPLYAPKSPLVPAPPVQRMPRSNSVCTYPKPEARRGHSRGTRRPVRGVEGKDRVSPKQNGSQSAREERELRIAQLESELKLEALEEAKRSLADRSSPPSPLPMQSARSAPGNSSPPVTPRRISDRITPRASPRMNGSSPRRPQPLISRAGLSRNSRPTPIQGWTPQKQTNHQAQLQDMCSPGVLGQLIEGSMGSNNPMSPIQKRFEQLGELSTDVPPSPLNDLVSKTFGKR